MQVWPSDCQEKASTKKPRRDQQELLVKRTGPRGGSEVGGDDPASSRDTARMSRGRQDKSTMRARRLILGSCIHQLHSGLSIVPH